MYNNPTKTFSLSPHPFTILSTPHCADNTSHSFESPHYIPAYTENNPTANSTQNWYIMLSHSPLGKPWHEVKKKKNSDNQMPFTTIGLSLGYNKIKVRRAQIWRCHRRRETSMSSLYSLKFNTLCFLKTILVTDKSFFYNKTYI